MTPTKLLIGTVLIVLSIAVGGVWFATEWAAWHLAFQPQLGAPWFGLFGYPVYPIWALFVWWYAYDAHAPTIFDEAGAIAAFSGVVGCAYAIGGSLWRERQFKEVTTYGSSRWAVGRDIAGAGLFDPTGVFLGQFDHRYLCHNRPEHGMAFAPTHSGKGVGLVRAAARGRVRRPEGQLAMAIIGTFSKARTGGWEGKIRMLSAVLSARFVPNDNRETEAAPHFRLLSEWSELDAAWVRRSGTDNNEFLSVLLDHPTFDRPPSAALFYADGGDRAHLVSNRRQNGVQHGR